ncbi:MAG: hypothetical protein ACFFCX_16690, partial [Candidatus Sifarchaeia archaeon]
MNEKTTNVLVAILLIAVVANGAVSVGLYNQVQDNLVATQIDAFESQIEDLILQLDELQTSLVFLNGSMIQEIQEIRENLTELQQTLSGLDLGDVETQLAEIQARIDQISASIGARDFSMMDYNLNGTFTNWIIRSYLVVNASEFNQDGTYLGWPEDSESPFVKGLWRWLSGNIWTPDDNSSVWQGSYTLVMLIWSPYRNISTSWNAIDAVAVHDEWYDGDNHININSTMTIQGVGDAIEMTNSP